MKKAYRLIVSLLLVGCVFLGFQSQSLAAQPNPDPASVPVACPINPDAIPTLQCLESIFANSLKAIFALAGVVAFVVLVMGGFKYITAGGDEKAVGEAQKMLTGAIGGLVLVVAAYAILNILTYYIFGSNKLFNFNIPG